ncbi:MAG: twin-arginine translocase subunit TatC [Deltaproteobacteria bacterium]|nr:twin-arginine translocase subunit TatC [Deltaproteobacteria bacterium]MBI2349219.1 twin-arginine translocase subunit TatC [Deltaproteobacteria bacterium]MBI2992037.1 twin-arginine translocase subunit TatC [Deltaproteobacteria bacterium]MBI3061672.1 twin-arginine translocase subunit TatC [Deltaproteobacteria bacterium]
MGRDPFMTFTEHLEDLRWCLIKSLAAVVSAFLLCFQFSDRIVAFMIAPLMGTLEPGQGLIGTGVAEAFFFEMKVALVAGAFLASPVIFYQLWRFIAPGLKDREKRLVIPFVLFTSLFFLGGAYFCYRAVLPVAFLYFIDQYRSLAVSPEIRIGEYFTFFSRMILAFGITFELPLFTFFLVRLGLWDYRTMWRTFRYAIIAIFIVAAILTPGPDIASQILLAIPLTLLYLLSIGVAYLWRKTE